jgi:hypothetical protein
VNVEQTGIPGTICILDDEPRSTGRHCGELDLCLCQSQKVTLSIAVMVQPVSGPVCLFGSEFQKVCWEILVAGSEQGMEAGQVGLRLVTKGERMTTVAKEWNIGASSIADGRYPLFTTIALCIANKIKSSHPRVCCFGTGMCVGTERQLGHISSHEALLLVHEKN